MDNFKPAAIFKDNMVLQQNKNINFWGNSDPYVYVSLKIKNNIYKTKASSDGKWRITVPPVSAGGPYDILFSDGEKNIICKNVMIGEVWFAGGQSNMEFELKNSKEYTDTVNEIKKNKPDIRFYLTPRQSFFSPDFDWAEQNTKWTEADEDEIGQWSAVAFYAAKRLTKKLPGITIGIIGCYFGGSSASVWVDNNTLKNDSVLSEYIDDYQKQTADKTPEEHAKAYQEYQASNSQWWGKYNEIMQIHPEMTWDDIQNVLSEYQWCPPLGPYSPYRPCALFETMFTRVCPYTVKGIWFYQGESDTYKSHIYYRLFTSLINKWRECWHDYKLPFIFIQLPMYGEENSHTDAKEWAYIREAQNKTFDTIKNTGMVVILDQGDFSNIHPPQKKCVGMRLADQSIELVYGKNTDSFGPMYSRYEIHNNKIKIIFDYADNGFYVKGSKISGFEIAGSNKIFFNADAQIQKNCILLSAQDVPEPVFARYNFRNYAPVTLFGKNGVPAAPFRTSHDDE